MRSETGYKSGDKVLIVKELLNPWTGEQDVPRLHPKLKESLGKVVTIAGYCFTCQVYRKPTRVYRVEEWHDNIFLAEDCIAGYANPFMEAIGYDSDFVVVLKNGKEVIVEDEKLIDEDFKVVVDNIYNYSNNLEYPDDELSVKEIYLSSEDYIFDKGKLTWGERK